MMTEIGEITVGTLLKRVAAPSYDMTLGKVYKVVESGIYGIIVNDDRYTTKFVVPRLYKVVGHVDDNIIEELDQMFEFCLKYNELESYIVNNA